MSSEHESAIVRAVLRSGAVVVREVETEGARPADFARGDLAAVLAAAIAVDAKGDRIDVLSVIDELRRTGGLATAGGEAKVRAIAESIAPVASVAYSAREVVERAHKRRVVELCQVVQDAALDPATSAAQVISDLQSYAMRVGRRAGTDARVADRPTVAQRVIDSIGAPREGTVETPWRGLTDLLHLGPGKLVVVGARPGMGKSALVAQLLAHAADAGTPGAIVPLEMGPDEMIEREIMVAAGSGRTAWATSREHRARAVHAAGVVAARRLAIVDEHKMSMRDIATTLRGLRRTMKIGIAAVDYIQLVDHDEEYRHKSNRVLEIGEVTKGLKQIARELEIPVIAVCQLSRKVEERTDKRPMLSDLRDSGQIEQDADAVVMLYRPEYYLREKTPEEWRGIATVDVVKQRGGVTGSVSLRWTPHAVRFDSVEPKAIMDRHVDDDPWEDR